MSVRLMRNTQSLSLRPNSASYGVLILLSVIVSSQAHEHHSDDIPDGSYVSPEPLDGILWAHILLMILAFGIIFPFGMVLGLAKSRWHVPVQISGTLVAIPAWFLAHLHKGRQFAPNIHASFATVLIIILVVQLILGVYLKLHLQRGVHGKIRPGARVIHGILGKTMPVVSWIQMIFGGITALGFCRQDHLGQCLAHFIMGSSFVAYGILLLIVLQVGQEWLQRTGKSQEFFDSAVITVWGCINTFTEHRWGHNWSHGDYQHTSMGIVWWCAGLTGLWLSRSRRGNFSKRHVIPALVIVLTGWAMSGHAQHLPISTAVHATFGYTLMAAGFARIVEIAIVLRDQASMQPVGSLELSGEPSSWQYLPPFLIISSGFIFMFATEEQLAMIAEAGIDHVSYLLIIYSVSFLVFLFANILIALPVPSLAALKMTPAFERNSLDLSQRQRDARDFVSSVEEGAEDFELEGLISDEEAPQDGTIVKALVNNTPNQVGTAFSGDHWPPDSSRKMSQRVDTPAPTPR